MSDIEITRQSQILQLLQPGDGAMADKGFQIEKMLIELGATLIIPPMKKIESAQLGGHQEDPAYYSTKNFS